MLLQALREQVIETCLKMLENGVAQGTQGNVSTFDRESGYVVITPSAMSYHIMKPEDICVLTLDAKPVECKWKPTSETPLHLIFYNRRTDVQAVVHTHPLYCSTFSAINESVPMILNEAAMHLNAPIPIAPYARPGSQELAEVTLKAMEPNLLAGIMAHHGLVTVGQNLDAAFESTLAAEMTAHIVIMARSMGKEVISMDPAECATLREVFLRTYKAKAI
jgi:L-ribulose-5-phosphate 4-epimerase